LNVRHLSPLFTWKDDKLILCIWPHRGHDLLIAKKAERERKASTRTKPKTGVIF
jgi:hypothetical protein